MHLGGSDAPPRREKQSLCVRGATMLFLRSDLEKLMGFV